MTTASRPGVTLIELVIAIALLSLMASIVVAAGNSQKKAPPIADAIEQAREAAIHSGREVPLRVIAHGIAYRLVAEPDGSIVGDSALGIDRLSGHGVGNAAR